ncbi:hypothetical protein NL676_008505, partial [Syzygium grande]
MVTSFLLSTRSSLAVFFFSLFSVDTTSFHGVGVSASSTPFSTTNVTKNKDEAQALLNWKSTFDNYSQSLLSSWHGDNPCGFTGVACDNFGAIAHLNLSYFGLRGTLDGLDFFRLTSVVSFELANNSIYGSIPSSIGNLSKLNSLNLCFNELSGDIPPNLGPLPNVKAFNEAPFEAIQHNKGLCGNVIGLPKCNSTRNKKLYSPLVELAYSTIPTEKCDVYSFGVVALETIMGKHLGNHVSWECSLFAQTESMMLKDVLDQRLSPSKIGLRDAQDVVLIAKLAFECLQADPRLRPTMRQVSLELCSQVPLDMPLSAVSLGQLHDLNVKKSGAIQEM